MVVNEDGSLSEDVRVSVIEASTGRTLVGEDAPFMSQLSAFLELHPGWGVVDTDSDDEAENDDGNYGDECFVLLCADDCVLLNMQEYSIAVINYISIMFHVMNNT